MCCSLQRDLFSGGPVACCTLLQCVAVCCSVLQCVVVCCSVLQCVVVCCSLSVSSLARRSFLLGFRVMSQGLV